MTEAHINFGPESATTESPTVRTIRMVIGEATAAERERCAKIAEAYRADEPETVRQINYRNDIAALIRNPQTK
jgi:hypothetical protein